ncbi:hypothetical protein ACA910_002381 [Epithemia clementina (nom. ined.)]
MHTNHSSIGGSSSGVSSSSGHRSSLASRVREVRKTRQRSLGQEHTANSSFFARQRPPSPSTIKGSNNNNHSPPSSPLFDDNDNPNSPSPNRRPRTPVNRPPLKNQQQQQPPQQQQQQPPASASANGIVPSSLSWDEPPELTLNNSSSNSSASRLNSPSDRSVSSDWAPSPQSPTQSRSANRHYSPTPQQQQDSSNLSVVSDSCLLSPDAPGGSSRHLRKRINNHGAYGKRKHLLSQKPHNKNNNNNNNNNIINTTDSGEDSGELDDDIPMDERSADIRSFTGNGTTVGGGRAAAPPHSVNFSRQPNSNRSIGSSHHPMSIPPQAAAPVAVPDDDVSSLGGVEENNVAAMTAGLRAKTPTLNGLTQEESVLWDTMQAMLNEGQLDVTQLQEKMTEQQEEHERAMRAIQRVLADVTNQRDQAVAELEAAKDDTEEKKEFTEEIQQEREEEVRSLRNELVGVREELSELQERYSEVKALKDASETELESQRKQVAKLKRHLNAQKVDPSEDPEKLKRQLDEKSSALENAKMIITSLENASGDLASDTRVKLKAKDMEIAALKMELHQCKKKLDTLATELRDVQRASAESDDYKMHMLQARSELSGLLENALAELRSASVILETTRDPSSVQNLSELFEDCSEALKRSLDHFAESEDDEDGSSRMQRQMLQKQELILSESETRSMQEELRKCKEEALHYRLEAERVEKQRENEVKHLYAEIQMLRMECSTNMEVLTKKERELVVLRDSLKVEDDEVGYISDDAEDDDEDDNAGTPPPPRSTTSSYTTSQAEALVTLLAHAGQQQQQHQTAIVALTGNPPDNSDEALKAELAQARLEKERAMKELKTEKESLANAKMIISSLEKANKSMMEDLRSRLHDSNTAIASLLEKSMESEKTTAKLQAELETEKARNEERLRLLQQQYSSSNNNNNNYLRKSNKMAAETLD